MRINSYRTILPFISSTEGVFMRRRDSGRRGGARGRGATYPAHPGGPGQPSAGTKTGRPKGLDDGGNDGTAEAAPGRARQAPGPARKHGAGDRKAAMERRVASASIAR